MSNTTRDKGINALRQCRQSIEDNFAVVGAEIIEMRHTIKTQAHRILELEASLANTTAQLKKATTIKPALSPASRGKTTAIDEYLAELKDELEVRTNQANEFQRRMHEYQKPTLKAQIRLNRIAAAIKRRINDNHLSIALMLCDALMEETDDGPGSDRPKQDAEAVSRERPNARTQTVRSVGTPYLFD